MEYKRYDLTEKLKALNAEIEEEALTYGMNVKQVIRQNFDELEKIVVKAKRSKKNSDGKKVSSYTRILKLLLEDGLIQDESELPRTKLSGYMSDIRKERQKAKTEKHSLAVKEGIAKKKEEVAATSSVNKPLSTNRVTTQPTPHKLPRLTEEQLTAHNLDWNDTSWYHDIGEEEFFLANFNRYYRKDRGYLEEEPITDENGNYIWSDYWENLYRFIIREARQKKLHDYQIQIPVGHHDSKVSYIWEKLTKVRKALGMNVDGSIFPKEFS